MKFVVAFFIMWSVYACKSKELSKVPDDLVGKWKMTSQQVTKDGIVEWQDVPEKDSIYMFFSRYGEYVTSNGLVLPCGPSSLRINGSFHKIEFHSEPFISIILGLCAECPTWDLELDETRLILQRCSPNSKMLFVKVD
ncbi:hypothetical protein [Dyadobacter sp.]|uniref:hypothetical protein n=1 Tax=Dyadobacter sp. TaxID=1914288 RepID=UPI003263B397